MDNRYQEQVRHLPAFLRQGVTFLLLVFLLAACAAKPTRVTQTPERKRDTPFATGPAKISEETVIIDARPAFEYSMAHVPRSINLQWEWFTEREPENRGVLQKDLFAVARRLARAGIGPQSHVVVVGNGLRGNGEEGRLAWMLAYFGVENVQFADLDSMKFRLTNLVENQPPKNAPMWKPEPISDLNATRGEVQFVINRSAVHTPAAFKPGSSPVLYRLIDVRSEGDYLGREGFGARRKIPNMDAINIPWHEFFHPSLRVRTDLAEKLRKVGVLPEHRIIVLSEDGVPSAAVTLALRAMGFTNSANYSGGLRDLLSAYSSEN